MDVVVSRTSSSYSLDDEPPIEGARKEPWTGIDSNGDKYTEHEWVITINSLEDFVDSCACEVIVSKPFEAGRFENIEVKYKVEIYDDYRE